MTARFKKWVADAWWDIQLEQDDDGGVDLVFHHYYATLLL